jgi:hypothetical protein
VYVCDCVYKVSSVFEFVLFLNRNILEIIDNSLSLKHTHTHTHTHIFIVCVSGCVSVCVVCVGVGEGIFKFVLFLNRNSILKGT